MINIVISRKSLNIISLSAVTFLGIFNNVYAGGGNSDRDLTNRTKTRIRPDFTDLRDVTQPYVFGLSEPKPTGRVSDSVINKLILEKQTGELHLQEAHNILAKASNPASQELCIKIANEFFPEHFSFKVELLKHISETFSIDSEIQLQCVYDIIQSERASFLDLPFEPRLKRIIQIVQKGLN